MAKYIYIPPESVNDYVPAYSPNDDSPLYLGEMGEAIKQLHADRKRKREWEEERRIEKLRKEYANKTIPTPRKDTGEESK